MRERDKGWETVNYRFGVVAKGLLWVVICHTLFYSVLCR